ncbi:MAG TPA: hypothetical protein VF612_15530 [Jatrophihabitans sp.]|uniref:hypothetical protein n=1 Tax=Jatrophihabitans sp. TaxID=1932789 RepID=UPI002F05ECB5
MSLEDGMRLSGMSYPELWLRHISLSGAIGEMELEAYVLGLLVPDDYQHNMIAQALNEYFIELGQDLPVGYRDTATAG